MYETRTKEAQDQFYDDLWCGAVPDFSIPKQNAATASNARSTRNKKERAYRLKSLNRRRRALVLMIEYVVDSQMYGMSAWVLALQGAYYNRSQCTAGFSEGAHMIEKKAVSTSFILVL